MKTSLKMTLAMLTGISIGIAGTKSIRAQEVKTPPAYFIAEVQVNDLPMMQKYGEKVPATLAPTSCRC